MLSTFFAVTIGCELVPGTGPGPVLADPFALGHLKPSSDGVNIEPMLRRDTISVKWLGHIGSKSGNVRNEARARQRTGPTRRADPSLYCAPCERCTDLIMRQDTESIKYCSAPQPKSLDLSGT